MVHLSSSLPGWDHKNTTSKYSMHLNKFILESLEFFMKNKDIPKFDKIKTRININVFELTGAVLTPLHIITKLNQQQIVLLLYENHFCLITKLHCLINKDSYMKHVCRRCLTAFSSEDILNQLIDRCQKQEPTKISFSYKDHLKFEDHHMKVPVPKRVDADIKCLNQPQNNPNHPKVLFKQIPIAVGFHLISPFGNQYYTISEGCVKRFVNKMLTLEKNANKYFQTNLEIQTTPHEEV